VLALRHFEQLNTNETAKVVGISAPAAGKRNVRALKRLKDILDVLPRSMGEF
jgi:DNA-directed RNA polymerase specialized sigma24 family protein